MSLVRSDRLSPGLPDAWRHWLSPGWPESWRRLFDMDVADWMPVEELQEGPDLVVRAELPGIDPEKDVELTIADGVLRIKAHREEKSEHKGKDGYRSEFHYGSLVRDVVLPSGARQDDVKATYNDGILEVRLPVKDEEKSAVVKVPVSRG